MAGIKTDGSLPCMVVRNEKGAPMKLNTGQAAEWMGVKTRYLAMATWRPGGNRRRKKS